MVVNTGRLLELIGSFLLGGGVVAMAYELAGPRAADPTAPTDPDDPAVSEAETGAMDSDGPQSGAESPTTGPSSRPAHLTPTEDGSYQSFPTVYAEPAPFDAEAEEKFPKHALVVSLAVVLRERPEMEAPIIGIVRAGTRMRTDSERTFGGGCSQGWQHVFPRGWICRKAGIAVEDTPPVDARVTAPPPDVEASLPYEYWRIKDEMTPFFHRLPSYEEQDRADTAGRAWFDKHHRDPMPSAPSQRPKEVPAVVKEYLNAAYYVTRGGEETKAKRRFLRTLRGVYARKYQLRRKDGSGFRGKLIASADELPMYFIRRELPLFRREAEGSDVLHPTETMPERLTTYPFVRSVYVGNKKYYENAEGLLLRSYGVGEAYKLKRPPGVESDEHWIHIDLSEQVLVAYDGDTPTFATLVSTGKQPGMTPVGVHRVQSKHIATSMRDQPVEEEAYSIEDVPWTQYFHRNVALHGAFWHGAFGLVRSHGCVNLSPADARWLFGFTGPPVPSGWHSVSSSVGQNGEGSAIVVTE